MRAQLHVNQDLLTGLMFMALGLAGFWLGRELPLGTLLRMGPGYTPWLLCWGLVILGGVIAVKGAAVRGEALERWHLRPLVLLPLAVLAFAASIGSAGLVLASVLVVVVGALAGPEFRLIEVLALALGFAAGAVALFVYGLGLNLTVWPS